MLPCSIHSYVCLREKQLLLLRKKAACQTIERMPLQLHSVRTRSTHLFAVDGTTCCRQIWIAFISFKHFLVIFFYFTYKKSENCLIEVICSGNSEEILLKICFLIVHCVSLLVIPLNWNYTLNNLLMLSGESYGEFKMHLEISRFEKNFA